MFFPGQSQGKQNGMAAPTSEKSSQSLIHSTHIYWELLAYYLPATVPGPGETSANSIKPPPGADVPRGGVPRHARSWAVLGRDHCAGQAGTGHARADRRAFQAEEGVRGSAGRPVWPKQHNRGTGAGARTCSLVRHCKGVTCILHGMGRHLRGSAHRRDPGCPGSWYSPSGCCVENELFGVKRKAGTDGPGGRWCGLTSGWRPGWPGSRCTVQADPFRFADGWGAGCERKSRVTLGTLA